MSTVSSEEGASMPEQEGDAEGNDERITDLEERIAVVEAYQENIVADQLMDRVSDLEEQVGRMDELERENAELRAKVHDLQSQLDAVNDLAEDQQSTPEKRAADVRMALIRRAKARSDGENRAAMHYKDVEHALADLGHEGLHDPQLFRAMKDAAEAGGFTMGEKDKNGNKIQAVRVDLDALPANAATNEINSGGDGSVGQNTGNPAD